MDSERDWYAHDTATVEDGAHIGAGARIWHHAHIRSGARIGAGANLGKNTYVDDGAVVGERTKVQNNVSVYTGVTLGDDVFVGPSVVFTNDLFPRAFLTTWEVHPTVVANGASLGANSTIVCGITIGSHAMIGAGSVVTRDVQANELVVGNPARRVGWVDRDGQVVSHDHQRPEGL
ncbi:MAG: N-acetyltransferase [Acidimicrobiia bacterium]|nr:N-acetyltransferase [Acidimicrobiia bacterium]